MEVDRVLVFHVYIEGDQGPEGDKGLLLSKTIKLVIHNYLDLAIEIREAMKIIQYPRVTPSTETLNNYWNPRVSSLMIIILYGSKTSNIMRKCWVSNTKLLIVAAKSTKMCFSPRGSVWSFEGWILLRISLKMAVRSFWSDLEKFPKSASGEILEGSGQHFGLGTFLSQK